MGAVLSTESPSCVTGSLVIPKALLILSFQIETLCRALLVCMRPCSEEESSRCFPRGPTCLVSVPQTGEDSEEATQEVEVVVTVHRDTTTAPEADSGTSQQGRNIRHPTLTMEDPRWQRDSTDTWATTNRCLNVTHVSFSSHHHLRIQGQSPADSITLNSASTTCSRIQTMWEKRSYFKPVHSGITVNHYLRSAELDCQHQSFICSRCE